MAIRLATQSPKRVIHVIPTILECPVHPSAHIRPSSAQGRYKALERARLNLPVAVATQQPCARPSLSGIGIAQQERLHEEFKRRIKMQTVLPSAETAAMRFWALLAAGQINMRKADGLLVITFKNHRDATPGRVKKLRLKGAAGLVTRFTHPKP